jgi:cell division protein FtsB
MHQTNFQKDQGKVALNILIGVAIFALGLIYLYQMNSIVSQGYALRNSQKEFNDLVSQQKAIEAEIAQMQSLPKIQEAVQNLGMAQADNISYLGVSDSKVVMNDLGVAKQ